MPLSATASSTHSCPSATLRTRSVTSPSFVNLQALLSRLSRICRSRIGSTVNAPKVLLRVDDEAVLVLLGKLSGGSDDLVDQRCSPHGLWVELELSGLDLRQVEHLVDEAKEVCPSAIYALQRLLRLFGAEARRVFDHHLGQPDDGVERRTQLVAHAGDELRLVLARQLQLAVLVLDLIEQPHVFDCDHRLIGEGCDELNLLVGERRDLCFPQGNCAERHALTQQWYSQHGPEALQFQRFRKIVFWVRLGVCDLDRTELQQRATRRGLPPCADWGALPKLQEPGRVIVVGSGTAEFAVIAKNHAVPGSAKVNRILQQRLKNTLEVERRPADGFEHLGRSGLLPQ